MSEVNVTRYDDLVRRVLQVKALPVIGQIAPEMFATFEIQPGDAPEMRWLRGEAGYAGTGDITPTGLGTTARVILNNPGGSNAIVVVDHVESHAFRIAGLSFVVLEGVRNPTAPGAATGLELDFRQRRSPDIQARSIASIGVETNPAGPGIGYAVVPVTGAGDGEGNIQHNYWRDFGCVLLPGFGLNVFLTASTNLGRLIVNFKWRERAIEDSEVMLPISLP